MTDQSPAEVGSRYHGTAAEEYWRYQEPMGRLGGLLEVPKFLPYVTPDDSIVDFGCGGGFLLEQLRAGRKRGIEVSAVARAAAIGRGLEVHETLAEVADASADVVISNHALEHTLNPFGVLQEFHRILRPKGRVILWLPIDDFRRRVKPGRIDPDGHLYTWSPLVMSNLLKEAGFSVERAVVVANAWPPLAARLRHWPRLYAGAARAWAIVRRRRQLHVVAVRPH